MKGQIDLILGPMFAGKTSELLRRVEDHEVSPVRAHPFICICRLVQECWHC